MSDYLSWHLNINVSKQAIDERFTQEAYQFVLLVLNYVASKRMGSQLAPSFLSAFNRVRIKDSTKFKLPDSLQDQYKGHGGFKKLRSAISIQFEYDLKTNMIIGFSLTSETRNDFEEAKEETQVILEGDLLIRDLGYWSINKFKQIKSSKAYFISRLNMTIEVFDLQGKILDFNKIYRKMKKYNLPHLELLVRLGKKDQMLVRLCISLVPDEIYQKRIKKLEKQNQRYPNATIQQKTKDRYHLNLFVTNVPLWKLDHNAILEIYHFRWQIELIFKQWKSIAGLASITQVRAERFLCMLYAKLILILISYNFMHLIRSFYYRTKKLLLSSYKCMQTLWIHFDIVNEILQGKGWRNLSCIEDFICRFARNHVLEKRNTHVSYEDLMYNFIDKKAT